MRGHEAAAVRTKLVTELLLAYGREATGPEIDLYLAVLKSACPVKLRLALLRCAETYDHCPVPAEVVTVGSALFGTTSQPHYTPRGYTEV